MSQPTKASPAGHKDRRSWIVAIASALVVALVIGAWWIGRRSAQSAGAASSATQQPFTQTKQVVNVTKGSMADTVSADGTVAAAKTDDLSFSSSGTVTAVNVKAGDTVKAGQVLASIDPTALEATVVSATSTLADANAKLSDDENASASSDQLAADRTSVTSAADSLSNAIDALKGADLVATFSGTVASVDLTVGEVLGSSGSGGTTPTGSASGSGLSSATSASSSSGNGAINPSASSSSSSSSSAQIQVVSTGRFTVDLAVDSSDVESVKVGQSVSLTVTTARSSGGFGGGFPGGFGGGLPSGLAGGLGNNGGGGNANRSGTGTTSTGASATGKVSDVSKVASASSGVATYTVTVAFTADPKQFFVGSTVSGAITTASRTNVVQLPSRAVSTQDGASTVTLAVDGTANGRTRTQQVTTGVTINGQTEIVSGLTAGQKVIVQGIAFPGGGAGFPGGGTGGTGGGGGGGGASPFGGSGAQG